MKLVDAKWLAERFELAEDTLLILDSRSSELYNEGCIHGSVNVCCTGGIAQRRLKNGSLKIESLLHCQEDKEKYARARDSDKVCVVVLDSNSPSTEVLASDSTAALLLKKLSRDCKYVAFLSHGYDNFQNLYSDLCVLDTSKVLQKRPSSLVLQVSNLTFNLSDSSGSSSEDDSPNASKDRPFEILPHLYLGCRKVASCLPSLKENKITRVLNVTSSLPNQFIEHGFTYKQIAVEDSHEVDMLSYLPEAFQFIEDAKFRGEKVLVHCHAGMSRSVTVIIAYLMKYYSHTLDSAYEFVKQRKPNISPNFSFMGQLLEFECSLRPSPADSGFGSHVGSPVDCFLTPVVPRPTGVVF